MAYSIKFTKAAEKDITSLSEDMRLRAMSAIRELANNPRGQGSIKMSGYKNVYRVRVGEYRIVYEIRDNQLLVIVSAADKRGSIYRVLKRRLK